MMPTVFASARSLGLDTSVAFLLQWPVSIAALATALWLFFRDASRLGRSFALLCATFLVSPYGFDYDMGALTVAAAMLVGAAAGWTSLVAFTAVAFLPAFVLLLSLLGAPVAPAVLVFALAARVVDVARGQGRIASSGTNVEYR
jgi:hypothetical protein